MGMAREAIIGFPDDSAQAYIALGEYAELLEVNQEISLETVYAHIVLGRLEELGDILVKGSYHQEWAQCYLDPEAILIERLPDINGHVCVAQILTVIKG